MQYIDSFLKTFDNKLTKSFASFQYVNRKHMTMFNFMGDFNKTNFKLFYEVFLMKLCEKLIVDRNNLHKVRPNKRLDLSQFYKLFSKSDHALLDFFYFLTKIEQDTKILDYLDIQVIFNSTCVEFTESVRLSVYYSVNQFRDFSNEEEEAKYYNHIEDLMKLVQEFKNGLVQDLNFLEESNCVKDNYLFNLDIKGDNTLGFFLQDTEL